MDRGRPRAFDPEQALDRALAVFWRDGYQGASLAELTAAMGINKPSLYAAFGDKESLYLKSLARYAEREVARHVAVLESEPDARAAVEGFLRSIARLLTDPARPGGCFVVTGAADCGLAATPAAVDTALRSALRGTESKLRARLARAQAEGQLPAGTDLDALAALFGTVVAGMGVQAKGGARRAELYRVIEAALAAWPQAAARAGKAARHARKAARAGVA